jgi:hypothetical protein
MKILAYSGAPIVRRGDDNDDDDHGIQGAGFGWDWGLYGLIADSLRRIRIFFHVSYTRSGHGARSA